MVERSIGGSKRRESFDQVRGPDGRQRWVKAGDLRQAKEDAWPGLLGAT